MKKIWRNPVKGHPPSPETLAIKGDWDKFTEDMKGLFSQPPKEKQKPISASASHGPVSSS